MDPFLTGFKMFIRTIADTLAFAEIVQWLFGDQIMVTITLVGKYLSIIKPSLYPKSYLIHLVILYPKF